MEQWKRSFLDKLSKAQSQWVKKFDDTLERSFAPAFDDLQEFLASNGFKLSSPLRENGRRSFKFELAENAYLLLIFRATGVGELELRSETFAPGAEPLLTKVVVRVGDVNESWAREQLQSALETFVDLLVDQAAEPSEKFVAV